MSSCASKKIISQNRILVMIFKIYLLRLNAVNTGAIQRQYNMVVYLLDYSQQRRTSTGPIGSLSSPWSVQILTTCYHGYPQDKTERVIKHYQLTSQWPDYDIPDSTGPVLEFVKFVRSKEGPFKEDNGPTLVHCG